LVYGYLDAKFTEFLTEDPIFPELGTMDLAGNPLPNGPRHMGKVSLRHGFPTSAGDFDFNVDWRFRDKAYFDPYKRESASQGAYSLVNARATFKPRDKDWSISIWGTNLFDKDAITHNYVSLASGGFPRNGAINSPRTYGLEFNYHTQ
jgi:iron complex outermembrane receptor protein